MIYLILLSFMPSYLIYNSWILTVSNNLKNNFNKNII